MEPNKIIFIALGGIGDVVMSSPTIVEVSKKYPEAKKYLLVFKGAHKEVFKDSPYIDEVIEFDYHKRQPTKKRRFLPYSNEIMTLLKLRIKGFDLSITPYPYKSKLNAMATKIINAKRRIGFEMDVYTDKAKLKKRTRTDKDIHDIEQSLNLLESLDIQKPEKVKLFFQINKEDRNFIKNWLSERKIDKFFCLHAGSYWKRTSRRLSADKFAKIADFLADNYNTTLIFIGTENEKQIIEEIKNKMENPIIIALNLTLKQTASLVEKASLFVGNESSLSNISSALNRPTVAFYRYVNSFDHYPYNKNSLIITKEPDSVSANKMGEDVYEMSEEVDKESFDKMTPEQIIKEIKQNEDKLGLKGGVKNDKSICTT